MELSVGLALVVMLALAFDLFNGINDSGALVATIISTSVMSPRKALALASAAEFVGPFLFGVAVANAIGTGIVKPNALTLEIVLAALFAALSWNVLAWKIGMPTSSTHALVGGIIGSAIAADGFGVLVFGGLLRIVIALLAGPILGGFLGYASLKLTLWLLRAATPGVNYWFKAGQVVTSVALALGHGAMDAQKTMGVITMALLATGFITAFTVPFWVAFAAGLYLALGVFIGGHHTIRTLGAKIYRVRPVHGFTSQASSALIVITAALLGGPLSVAQVVSSAIVGVGAGERISKVRWGIAGTMIISWLLTMPATTIIGASAYIIVASVLQ